jgi:hypothetical protein
MANVQPQEIDHLKQLLSEHHSRHEREHGAMERCHEPVCVEAKLGLRYLSGKMGLPQDSGSDSFNLK